MTNVSDVILCAEGGIGKNINASAVIRAIKKQHPKQKLHLISGYHDLFTHNPNIKRVYNFGNPLYFYDDYFIENRKETLMLKAEPYTHYDYYAEDNHIVDVWCKSFGVEPDGTAGDLFFTLSELNGAKDYVSSLTNEFKKDFVLLQWCGGKVPEKNDKKSFLIAQSEMYRRSLTYDTAKNLVKRLKDEGYVVGIVGHTNYPEIEGVEKIFFPIRQVLALLKFCKTFIGIDSFLQHAAACNQIQLPGVVCWGGTNPKKLGYSLHKNLTKSVCNNPMCHRPNSFLFDHSNGQMWACPHSEACLKYTVEEIMTAFNEVIDASKVQSKE